MRSYRSGRFLAVMALVGLVGCSFSSGPDDKPTSAELFVEGTAPEKLEVVISTDFYEVFNQSTLEVEQILNRADTVLISPPYEQSIRLTGLGSLYVALKNHAVEPAVVRMRINLDNGRNYDQRASLADRASIVYVYVFQELVL